MTPAQRALIDAASQDGMERLDAEPDVGPRAGPRADPNAGRDAGPEGADAGPGAADAAVGEAGGGGAVSPGRAVAAARIEAGLSVAEVSRLTFIRPSVVAAVERDDAASCGGAVYLRGHVRTIAAALGLDADAVLGRSSGPGPGGPAGGPPVRLRSQPPPAANRSPWSGWLGVAIVVLGVVAVLAMVDLLGGGGGSSDQPAAKASAAAKHAAARPSAAARATPRPVVPTGVTVTLTASGGRCWVGVTDSSGSALFGSSLASGDSRTFHDPDRLKITLGNPGVVTVRFNGTNLGSPGDLSHVARLKFVPEVTTLAQAMGTAPLPSGSAADAAASGGGSG